MDKTASTPGLRVDARVIPIPKYLSPQAQASLAQERPRPAYPATEDKAGWRTFIDNFNATWAPMLREGAAKLPVDTQTRTIAGVTVYDAAPKTIPAGNRDKVQIYLHGGALVIMGGECTRHFATIEAAATRCRSIAVDYRNPPEFPYPHALNDCVDVYREVIKTVDPKNVVISGSSGGGNLAAAVTLKIRDLKLPLPGAVGLWTPEVDLTEEGDTFATNMTVDHILGSCMAFSLLYANGHDLRDPYLSPIFADLSKGFPPTFIQAGTRDLFLSNAVRFHRALRRHGIDAELHVGEAMPHGGFGGAPEDQELRDEFNRFLARVAGWAPL